jgi:N-6 DNA Methylase/Type I restriction modification DNA specificity domain
MNMILHNNPTALVVRGNTLADPKFKDGDSLKTFDFVVANPPFSDKRWSNGVDPLHDPYNRFQPFGTPPARQGDYAYLLHIVRSLKSTGKGACILPHGVLFRGNAEADIRRALVRILICVRNGSRELIGKCTRIDERADGMTFDAFMAVFRTSAHRFVYHQFRSAVIKRQIREHLGATINQITNKSLNSFVVPLPGQEAEQEAIAEALSDMEAELATLEAKVAKARQLKQGMMQELLMGRIRLV